MNTGDARIPDAFHAITHRLRCKRRFLCNRDIARARGHDRDLTDTMLGLVAKDANHPRRLVPLCVGEDIPDVAVDVLVRPCYQNVWPALEKLLEDAANLVGSFALTENYFRKSLAL